MGGRDEGIRVAIEGRRDEGISILMGCNRRREGRGDQYPHGLQ